MAILNYLKHFVQRGKCFGTKQIRFISPAKKKKPSLFFGNLKSDWILNLISRFEKKNQIQALYGKHTYFRTNYRSSDWLSDVKKNSPRYE